MTKVNINLSDLPDLKKQQERVDAAEFDYLKAKYLADGSETEAAYTLDEEREAMEFTKLMALKMDRLDFPGAKETYVAGCRHIRYAWAMSDRKIRVSVIEDEDALAEEAA